MSHILKWMSRLALLLMKEKLVPLFLCSFLFF
jgi:hypothetical protein